MIRLCTDSAVPTLKSLVDSIKAQLPMPVPALQIPAILELPVPIYAGLSCYELELQQIIQALQSFQLSTTLLNIVKPLVAVVGGAIEDLLPKIPGLPFHLLDLIEMDGAALYAAVKQAIEEQQEALLALLPLPLFEGLSIPSIEIHTIVKMLKSYCMTLVLNLITGLVSKVTSILKITNSLALLNIPSLSEIKALILAAFPEYASWSELIRSGIEVADLFAALHLPVLPVLPIPLMSGFRSPEIEFNELLNVFYTEFIASQIAVVVEFVENTLGLLGFDFPTFCITL